MLWRHIKNLPDLYARVERLEKYMPQVVTRDQLDAQIAALPGTVVSVLTAQLQPIADKLGAHPDDFSAETALLAATPAKVANAITALFTPPQASSAGDGTQTESVGTNAAAQPTPTNPTDSAPASTDAGSNQ